MNTPCKVCGTPFVPDLSDPDESLCPSCWFEQYQLRIKAREAFGQQEMSAIQNVIERDRVLRGVVIGASLLRIIGLLLCRWTVHLTLFSACVDLYFLAAQFKMRKVVPLMLFSETLRMQMARVLFSVYAAFDWRVGLAFAALEVFGMLISFTVAMHDRDVH